MEAGDDVTKVYNLLLDNEHVYYANGYLVHNEKVGDDGRGTPDPGAGASASSTNNSGKPKKRTPMSHAVGPQVDTLGSAPGLIGQTMGGYGASSGTGVSTGGGLVNPFASVTPTNISGISQGGGPTMSTHGFATGGPAVSNNSPQGQAMMQQMMQQRRRRRRPNNPPPGTAYMPQMGPMASPLAKNKKK